MNNKQHVNGSALTNGEIEVFAGASGWTLNGVNVFSVNLVRGLRDRGIDAKILLTEERTALITPLERAMPRPEDVPFVDLPVHPKAGWGAHWGAMIRFLEECAPCIYIPNSDWRHSCVNPRLSQQVHVVGVVHSDDPLHYDHVARLGAFWNGITTTSHAIAEKVLAANSSFTDRLSVIPIGVSIPSTMPAKTFTADEPLRLIYHGVLKQYQKRILDFPKIVSACAEAGVPVTLTIAGGGPQEEQLMEASRTLVDRGLIRFLGVVPHDQIHSILEQHDVYVLASEFEGMPNALLEAMGRGCVPLVTRMESGIPEVVQDDHNGFLVPIGDIAAFVDRIRLLQGDVERRRRMSHEAYTTVGGGMYRTEDMVSDYVKVFERVLSSREAGSFVRPSGLLSPPPAEVDGVSVFPVELSHSVEGVGRFPTRTEWRDYEQQLELLEEHRLPPTVRIVRRYMRRRRLESLKVIVDSPSWTRNGMNFQVAHLVRGLQNEGLNARVLLTEEQTDRVKIVEPRLVHPADIPMDQLPVKRSASWGAHWGATIRYLEAQAPCIFIPNHDWRHSCVIPMLSRYVHVVGVLHGDDPLHYDHVQRLGDYWSAVVACSERIAQTTEASCPDIAKRLWMVPYGVDLPAHLPEHVIRPEAPLKIVGVCATSQKQHLSKLAIVCDRLRARQTPVEAVFVDLGVDEYYAETASPVRVVQPASHRELMEIFDEGDVLWMMSEVEGVYHTLMEAMGRRCVPVVDGVDESGAPLEDGRNAFLLPENDLERLTECFALLRSDLSCRRTMASEARDTALRTAFRIDDMVQAYLHVFHGVLDEAREGVYQRPQGAIQRPPARVSGVDIFPVELAHEEAGVGSFCSEHEYGDFRRNLPFLARRRYRKPVVRKKRKANVIVASPYWTQNGINVFTADLVHALRDAGWRARILLTEERTDLVDIPDPPMTRPADVPVDELPVERAAGWGAHWGAMIRYLESQSPCIYIPNHDWRHSCVSPALSPRVHIVGVVHSSDPLHFDHLARLGSYWNAIVAGSESVAQQAKEVCPTLAARMTTISYGVSIPDRLPERRQDLKAPLKVACLGRTVSGQGMTELADVLARFAGNGVHVELSVVNAESGDEVGGLRQHLNSPSSVRFVRADSQSELRSLLEESDVLWAASPIADAYQTLVEAMGRGCVPVVPMNGAQISVKLENESNAFLIPQGDVRQLADCLAMLQRDPERQHAMALQAHKTAARAAFRVQEMAQAYAEVFHRVLDDARTGAYERPRGPVQPPPFAVDGVSIFPLDLTHEQEGVGSFVNESDYRDFRRQLGLSGRFPRLAFRTARVHSVRDKG